MRGNALEIEPNVWGAAYPVRLPIFEGPLDLLLHLIEREEMDITEVSLVAVTDQYLRAIDQLEEATSPPGADALADFLLVAARLLYLKSRSLLPDPKRTDGADGDEEDPGDALIRQLLEYRRYKTVAAGLRARTEAGLRAFVRLAHPNPGANLARTLDLGDVSLDKLTGALQKALRRMPSETPPPRVRTFTVTVSDQIDRVRDRLSAIAGRVSFDSLLSEGCSRMEVVVTFLAILELLKQEEIMVEQDEVFGEIILRSSL